MLRLPAHVLDPATVARYCQGASTSAWTADTHVIIDLHDEDEDGDDEWDLDGHGLLTSIISIRAGLAAGDLSLLYLAWLRCVQSEEIADDEPEPPVPRRTGHPRRGPHRCRRVPAHRPRPDRDRSGRIVAGRFR